jgi:hypothetical protein
VSLGTGSQEEIPKTVGVVGEAGGFALERAPEGAPLSKRQPAANRFDAATDVLRGEDDGALPSLRE